MVDTKSQISEENKQLFIKEIDMLLKHDSVLSVQLVQVRFFFCKNMTFSPEMLNYWIFLSANISIIIALVPQSQALALT